MNYGEYFFFVINVHTIPKENRHVVKGGRCRKAKDAKGKFCLGKRCQKQPSANHVCVQKRIIRA